jgi:hypothetical protein
MADEKLTSLTALDAFASGDLLYSVDDPAGTPVSKKATIDQVQDYIEASANTFTATQTISPAVNTSGLVGSGYSLTGSASASFMDIAGTWNTTGTPSAIKVNITDTASNAASLLMDLQVGGASHFSVDKSGLLAIGKSNSGVVALSVGSAGNRTLGLGVAYNSPVLAASYTAQQAGVIAWSGNASTLSVSADTILTRRAAANLRFGAADAAAPVAQTLSVQSVVAGTTNTAGANLTITGSQGTGTGAGGSIVFQVAPAGGTGTAQNALSTALTIDSTGKVIVPSVGGSANPSLQVGAIATTGFFSPSGGNIAFTSTNGTYATLGNGIGLTIAANVALAWSNTAGNSTTATDLFLARDAANTLALRNGVNAQTFNVYNTYTDASNYERGRISWDSNVLRIGTEKAGTGTARALELQTDGVTRVTIAANGLTQTYSATGGVTNNTTGTTSAFIYARSTTGGTVNNTLGAASGIGVVGTESNAALQIRSFNVARLVFDTVGSVQIATALTVATLPGTPAAGMIARVTDASAPVIGTTVTGGGAAYALVNYNGANWTVIGV